MHELDDQIKRSLTRFVASLNQHGWTGQREREAINLYVMGFLLQEVRAGGILHDPTQIAIEVAVQQIAPEVQRDLSGRPSKPKAQVAKDLVIWPEPRQTTWTQDGRPAVEPLAILEWKWRQLVPSEFDVSWLKRYTWEHPGATGYAVSLLRTGSQAYSMAVTRVVAGSLENDWLHL